MPKKRPLLFPLPAQAGNSTIEYAIIIGTIALASLGGLTILGLILSGGRDYIANTVEIHPATPGPAATPTSQPSPTTTPADAPASHATPVPTPTPHNNQTIRGVGLFLFDNFDDGDAVGWYPALGDSWRVTDNRYCAGKVTTDHHSFVGDPAWTDYTISTRAELQAGDGFDIFFRASPLSPLNGYVFQYDPGYGTGAFLFRKISNNRESWPLAVVRVIGEFGWHNSPHLIEIHAQGPAFTAFIDGQQILQATDDAYPTGQIGLRLRDGSAACFDDITVKPLF